MRRLGVLAALLAALLLSGFGAGARAATTPRLAIMVLPRAAFGPAAASLPVDSDSGVVSTADEVRTTGDPRVSAASLARLGRTAGYGFALVGVPALSSGHGLVSVGSEVELFKTSRGAGEYARVRAAVAAHPRGEAALQPLLAGVKVSSFRVAGLAHQAFAVRVAGRLGTVTVTESTVGIRVGRALATLDVVEAAGASASVHKLARALERRVTGVLAGRIHGRPERLPAYTRTPLGRLGRPRGGPDLARMALAPKDFSPRAKLQHQGYRRNRDDVAEYVRTLGPIKLGRSVISGVESDVELQRSAPDALGAVTFIGRALDGPGGRRVFERAFGAGPEIEAFAFDVLAAGDAAYAVRATLKTPKGRVESAVIQIAVGRVVQTVSILSLPGLLSADDLAAGARLAASHMRVALG
jgi:hypothetical protein